MELRDSLDQRPEESLPVGAAAGHRHDERRLGVGAKELAAQPLARAHGCRGADIPAVPQATADGGGPPVVGRDVEHVARTVDEDVVVVVLHGLEGSLEVPALPDGGWGVEDVAQPEDHADLAPLQALERRHELAHRAVWHVVDEEDVRPEGQGGGADDLLPHGQDVGERHRERDRLPVSRAPLADGGQLEVFVPRRGGEELAEWRVADGEDAGAGLRGEELRREQGRAPQVPQTQAVLGVDQQTRPRTRG